MGGKVRRKAAAESFLPIAQSDSVLNEQFSDNWIGAGQELAGFLSEPSYSYTSRVFIEELSTAKLAGSKKVRGENS